MLSQYSITNNNNINNNQGDVIVKPKVTTEMLFQKFATNLNVKTVEEWLNEKNWKSDQTLHQYWLVFGNRYELSVLRKLNTKLSQAKNLDVDYSDIINNGIRHYEFIRKFKNNATIGTYYKSPTVSGDFVSWFEKNINNDDNLTFKHWSKGNITRFYSFEGNMRYANSILDFIETIMTTNEPPKMKDDLLEFQNALQQNKTAKPTQPLLSAGGVRLFNAKFVKMFDPIIVLLSGNTHEIDPEKVTREVNGLFKRLNAIFKMQNALMFDAYTELSNKEWHSERMIELFKAFAIKKTNFLKKTNKKGGLITYINKIEAGSNELKDILGGFYEEGVKVFNNATALNQTAKVNKIKKHF